MHPMVSYRQHKNRFVNCTTTMATSFCKNESDGSKFLTPDKPKKKRGFALSPPSIFRVLDESSSVFRPKKLPCLPILTFRQGDSSKLPVIPNFEDEDGNEDVEIIGINFPCKSYPIPRFGCLPESLTHFRESTVLSRKF